MLRKERKLNWYVIVCFLLCIFCLIHFFFIYKGHYPYSNEKYSDIFSFSKELPTKGENTTILAKKEKLLEFLYKERKEQYFRTIASLNTSINFLSLLALISILLLYFQPKKISLFWGRVAQLGRLYRASHLYLVFLVAIWLFAVRIGR